MPKVGDRVIIESRRVGEPRREGTLIGTVGPLINVRWGDGTVSLFKPAAGTVAYLTGNGSSAPRAAAKKPAKKGTTKTARKAPAKTTGKTSTKGQGTKGRTGGKAASGNKRTPSSKKVTKKAR